MTVANDKDKERLYDTMGELLYVLAMADGVIQVQEKEAMEDILDGHPWADVIKWSFDYEEAREADVEEVYKKVIDFCHSHGPAQEYAEFLEAMELISQAAQGGEEVERQRMGSFTADLIERFQRDLDKSGEEEEE